MGITGTTCPDCKRVTHGGRCGHCQYVRRANLREHYQHHTRGLPTWSGFRGNHRETLNCGPDSVTCDTGGERDWRTQLWYALHRLERGNPAEQWEQAKHRLADMSEKEQREWTAHHYFETHSMEQTAEIMGLASHSQVSRKLDTFARRDADDRDLAERLFKSNQRGKRRDKRAIDPTLTATRWQDLAALDSAGGVAEPPPAAKAWLNRRMVAPDICASNMKRRPTPCRRCTARVCRPPYACPLPKGKKPSRFCRRCTATECRPPHRCPPIGGKRWEWHMWHKPPTDNRTGKPPVMRRCSVDPPPREPKPRKLPMPPLRWPQTLKDPSLAELRRIVKSIPPARLGHLCHRKRCWRYWTSLLGLPWFHPERIIYPPHPLRPNRKPAPWLGTRKSRNP